MQLVPGGFAATVDTRLREAEAIDQSGDPSKAEAQLLDLRQRAASADDCRCALKRVITAQARFDLSRHRAAQAVTVLESSPFGRELRRVGEDLATTYAIALLDAKAVRRSCLWELDGHVRANIISPWNQASRVAMLAFAKSFCAQHDQKNVE